ncbi:MAG: oligoendopeptidase F, partial [Acholeplasmataceae bacterium]|nr:oligoendopeptidase F [Acholeplasmataceae bacterium]
FYKNEVLALSDELLLEAITLDKTYEVYLNDIIREKKHQLEPNVEKALAEFNQVLNAPNSNYSLFKFADMKFNEFEVKGNSYAQSFTLFENEWQYDTRTDLRRKAFENFYETLSLYENGLANNYKTHVLKDKAYANLKRFPNVTDYLLFNQKVTSDVYHRQIDLTMKHLSGPMRKFAKLLKEIYGLKKMTYADLNLPVDEQYEPLITIEEASNYASNALKVLGKEYQEMVEKAFKERWIDFPQNLGKSTGGFCSSPYQKGSYILLNWNERMSEAFVLAHELGHAGHFYFAGQAQTILNTRTSLYFIEAPSTFNELVMADYLSKEGSDLRFRRWILANLISRTYYHNFVTHLLEAAFQREVYLYVDANKPLNAHVLKSLKLSVLKEFWGEEVEIPDYAGLTWMRQPHYFMGLYPYTYSAGLTVSTLAFNKIKANELTYSDWLEVLKAGGTKTPLELAKMVDIDLSTDKPLLETIKIISDIIDEIIEITNKLK